MVMAFYFLLVLVLANVGKVYPQLGLTNGVYLGFAVSGVLWYFFGRTYTGVQ
jgi:hypothetical protein|tara:strand:- start:272 stop:427 length:156 start_codon:yes stop_codon:yes gene_type:complete